MNDDDCAECPDVRPDTSCPVCSRPMPARVSDSHDVEETRTPAPVWDLMPWGDA